LKARHGAILSISLTTMFGVAAPAAEASAPPAPTTRPAAQVPATLVAVQDGAVAVISTRTGQVVRRLTEPMPGLTDYEPYLSDDRRNVVFVRSNGSTCTSSIVSVPFGGGPTRVVVPTVTGFLGRPKLSRDSSLLAFQSYDCNQDLQALMVHTMRTGATHPITGSSPGDAQAIDYTFTADGRRLVAITTTREVWTVPVSARTFAAGRDLSVAEPGCAPAFVTRLGQSGYLAIEAACPGQDKVLKVNSRTGRHTILSILRNVAIEPGLTGIDYDATGQHILIQGQGGTAYAVTNETLIPIFSTRTFNAPPAATW
jgi:hypothetical protein